MRSRNGNWFLSKQDTPCRMLESLISKHQDGFDSCGRSGEGKQHTAGSGPERERLGSWGSGVLI